MKLIKKTIIIILILLAIYLFYKYVSTENMGVINIDKNNKEYMDMIISVTSIFGGIVLIIAVMALSTPITISKVRQPA
jgi:hypothetical protein